ncbi:hypothetical protein [Aneurinibacillus tyrosinisolvens]|uniref:hypothetical protein n=1 Tax=Aneurinibacillus tyrosinisolvens TaxID=1443435 RepID=UPI00069A54C8|nr:hypothetical protein [Aneurinibacillus tyrosinisolvens]
MDIYSILKHLELQGKKEYCRANYFRWKFGLYYHNEKNETPKTEKEFLHSIGRKSLDSLLKWERTGEYRALVKIYLASLVADDSKQVYDKITEQAKSGDVQSAKLHRDLTKQIEKEAEQLMEAFASNLEEDEDTE